MPLAQEPRYLHNSWGIAEGLPQNSVLSIHQQGNGYIWLGTRGGLVRFDGVNFMIYNKWTVDEIKNNEINSITSDQTGRLWIATFGGGVSTFYQGNWSNTSEEKGLASDYINTVVADNENRIWVGTNFGLNVIEKNRVLRVAGLIDHHILSILVLDNHIWVGCKHGNLFQVNSKNFKVRKKYAISGKDIQAMEVDAGRLWIGTDEGLFCMIGEDINAYIDNNISRDHSINSIKRSSSDKICIGTEGNGFFLLDNKNTVRLDICEELSSGFITSIITDHEGSIWVGTYTDGLIRLKVPYVRMIRDKKLPLRDMIYAVFQTKNDTLCAGSHTQGLLKINRDGTAKVEGLSDIRVKSICEDRHNQLWIGTERKGLKIISGNRIRAMRTASGLCSDQINVIIEDRQGRIWIGTDKGLNYIKEGSVSTLNKTLQVNALLERERGKILIAASQGLFITDGGQVSKFAENNYPENLDLTCLWEVRNIIFFGTNGSGLFYYNGSKVGNISQKQGLKCDGIFGIISDQDNNLWLSTLQGIIRLNIDEILSGTVNPVYLNEGDGMRTRECSRNVFPALTRNDEGTIYFSTLKGIAYINTKKIQDNNKPPRVKINDVLVEDRSVLSREGIKLPPGENMVEFYFSGLSFISPDKVRFKYMLEGEDDDWIEGGSSEFRSAVYINLKHGRYRFKVKACNNFGVWSKESASYSFFIKPYFYKTYLFYMLILVLLIGSVLFMWLFKKQKKQKKDENKYSTSTMTSEMEKAAIPRLMKKMEEEKVFLDANITLQSLAESLYIHRNHLSRIINEKYKMKFKDFLNKYRINEAKKMLLSKTYQHKNILAVVYDSGFNSKSVFNTAFKKFTGLTPSQYKNEASKNEGKKV